MMRDKEKEKEKYGEVKYLLCEILEQRSLSIRQFATLADMNPVVVTKAVMGETQPSFQQLARICSVLKIPLADLLEYIKPDG